LSAVFVFGYEKYHINIFKKTELKISQERLEMLWGKPDRVLKYSTGEKTVFYYTILDEFVFNIDKFEKVEFKYEDNF
jgi:hypothetical protein